MINKLYFIIIFFFVSCSEIDENEVESSAEDLIDWTSIDLTNDFVVGNFDEQGINKTKLQAELDNISDFFRSDLYSLGVLYKGKLIIENYYSGNADSILFFLTLATPKFCGSLTSFKKIVAPDLNIDDFSNFFVRL